MLNLVPDPLPPRLQDRGAQILGHLDGLLIDEQLDLACRTLFAVLRNQQNGLRSTAQTNRVGVG